MARVALRQSIQLSRGFFTRKEYWFPLALAVIFVTLVINRIHGSSIGVYWHYVQKDAAPDPALLVGEPRPIRSDEFMVSTAWILAQSRVNFVETNPLLGMGQNLVLTDAPVWTWEALFEPQNWSFFVLPLEYAFAFRWWFRAFLLLLSAYLFFVQLDAAHWHLAVLASISMFFTPIVQWWYSTTYLEIVAYLFLLLYIFQKMVGCRTKFATLAWATLFCYFSLCFASLLYLPTLITASISLVFLSLGILLSRLFVDLAATPSERFSPSTLKVVLSSKKNLFISLLAVLFFDILFLLLFYQDNRHVLNLVMSSSYPGQRRLGGGVANPEMLIVGFLSVFLAEKAPSLVAANQSEASSFLNFSIFLLPVLSLYYLKSVVEKKSPDYFLGFLILTNITLLFWSMFGLPEIIEEVFLLNHSNFHRSLPVLAVLNQIIVYYYLVNARFSSRSIFYRVLYSVFVFFLYLNWVNSIKLINLSDREATALLIDGLVASLFLLLFLGRKLEFWIVFTSFVISSTISVNPLYRGLDVILNSELSKSIQEVRSGDAGSRWVIYDSLIMNNYIAANGVKILNASQYHPQNALWGRLDPEGRGFDIYNRYAHITLVESEDVSNIDFVFYSPDHFAIKVHPCNSKLGELEVNYFVFLRPVQYDCLKEAKIVDLLNVDYYIYKRG